MDEKPYSEIDLIVANVLTNNASDEERRALESWTAQSQANRAYVARCAEALFAAEAALTRSPTDAAAAFHEFSTKVRFRKAPNKALRRAWQAAAACAAAACVAFAFYGLGQRGVEEQFRPIVIETPAGAHLKVTLPDGSRLYLNANSRVRYSQGFGVADRNLELEGEGYFEAAHNPALPLRVRTKNLEVEVLGTKFSVSNYADQPYARVSLVEGSVLLCDETQHELCRLEPNQLATFDKTTGRTTVESVDAPARIRWINGELRFNDEPMSGIAAMLEQVYGVSVSIADPNLDTVRFCGSFNQTQNSAEHILDALARTGRIEYTRQGTTIVVSAAKQHTK